MRSEKLLRTLIREMILEDTLKVGDIRQALKLSKEKGIKAATAAVAKEAGKKGVMVALQAIPGAGSIVSAIEAGQELKDLYDAATSLSPKEKKSNPLWDFLTIDPDTSSIVDDAVEANFINLLRDKVKNLDDDDELPNADQQLKNYLSAKYSGAHITKK